MELAESKQSTSTILMVRPANFGFNEETAANNAFQQQSSLSMEEISSRAIAEFDQMVDGLRALGVEVIVIDDTPQPVKYDAVFPNNWFSTHQNGYIVTYPMFSPNRRLERRSDIIDNLKAAIEYPNHLQLEHYENVDIALEGTGSLVLDRKDYIAYACRSVRTEEKPLHEFCQTLGYQLCLFDAKDENGQLIYHTNVMMAVGSTYVVICLDSIPEGDEKAQVLNLFHRSEKEVIEISFEQMNQFAGNMLEVQGRDEKPILVMSAAAYASLNPEQVEKIQHHATIFSSDISTIEHHGGGSARCMIAEIFAPL